MFFLPFLYTAMHFVQGPENKSKIESKGDIVIFICVTERRQSFQ